MEDFPERKQNWPHCSVADLILLCVCYVFEIPTAYSSALYREMDMLTKRKFRCLGSNRREISEKWLSSQQLAQVRVFKKNIYWTDKEESDILIE